MAFNIKEFKKKEKELMRRAVKIEASCIDNDPGSYEEYRDGFRFMSKLSVFFFSLAFIFNLITLVMVFFIEPAKTYLTTRDGRLQEVRPIARSTEDMTNIKVLYKNKPEALLKMRDFYNQTNDPLNNDK